MICFRDILAAYNAVIADIATMLKDSYSALVSFLRVAPHTIDPFFTAISNAGDIQETLTLQLLIQLCTKKEPQGILCSLCRAQAICQVRFIP